MVLTGDLGSTMKMEDHVARDSGPQPPRFPNNSFRTPRTGVAAALELFCALRALPQAL